MSKTAHVPLRLTFIIHRYLRPPFDWNNYTPSFTTSFKKVNVRRYLLIKKNCRRTVEWPQMRWNGIFLKPAYNYCTLNITLCIADLYVLTHLSIKITSIPLRYATKIVWIQNITLSHDPQASLIPCLKMPSMQLPQKFYTSSHANILMLDLPSPMCTLRCYIVILQHSHATENGGGVAYPPPPPKTHTHFP